MDRELRDIGNWYLYAVVAILPNGDRWFRWHIPGQHALAMVGALTVTASDVHNKAGT